MHIGSVVGLGDVAVFLARVVRFVVRNTFALLRGVRGAFEVVDAFIQVAEEAGAPAALRDALGKLTLGGFLRAERAFLDNAFVLVEVAHVIRAGHDAELAADALRLVNLDGTVGCDVRSFGGTHLHAFGVFAMLALHGQEIRFDILAFSLVIATFIRADAQHLDPEAADRHVAHGFARRRAG